MTITTAMLVGVATFAAYFGVTAYAVDRKIKYYNIVIDATNKEIRIACNTNGISLENFKVYTRIENKQLYLYIKGAEVLTDSKDIVSVEHKFCLLYVIPNDVCKVTYACVDKEKLVVTIPLSVVDRRIFVKRVK